MLKRVVGGSTGKYPERYQHRSPVEYIQHFVFPVLVIHGQLDVNVDPSHGLLMANQLKELKQPYTLYWYEHYAHHIGGNKNEREKYRGHKYYKDTIDFCENWDQKSFDPNFKSLTLKDFEPYIKKIFSRTPYSN